MCVCGGGEEGGGKKGERGRGREGGRIHTVWYWLEAGELLHCALHVL